MINKRKRRKRLLIFLPQNLKHLEANILKIMKKLKLKIQIEIMIA